MLKCSNSCFKMNIYFWIITFCTYIPLILAQSCTEKERRCRISRIYRMKGADCNDRNMRNFPQCLPADTEIIDASYNRIRKLKKDDLRRYTNLKMLYLSDNAIMVIDDEALEGKDDLKTLDLSLNSLSKLPPVVFHLPSLHSLYLGQNLNINIVDVVEKAKPVTSPLVQMDISYVMTEEPSELPEFGILPFLTKYNISGNKLMLVTTRHFAGLCSLNTLDTSNVTVDFGEFCDCWTLNRWLKSRQVQFKQLVCEIKEKDCVGEVPEEDLQIFNKCTEERETFNRKSRALKGAYIAIGVTLPVLFIVLIYFIVRRRRARSKKQMENRRIPDQEALCLNNKM